MKYQQFSWLFFVLCVFPMLNPRFASMISAQWTVYYCPNTQSEFGLVWCCWFCGHSFFCVTNLISEFFNYLPVNTKIEIIIAYAINDRTYFHYLYLLQTAIKMRTSNAPKWPLYCASVYSIVVHSHPSNSKCCRHHNQSQRALFNDKIDLFMPFSSAYHVKLKRKISLSAQIYMLRK